MGLVKLSLCSFDVILSPQGRRILARSGKGGAPRAGSPSTSLGAGLPPAAKGGVRDDVKESLESMRGRRW